MNTYDTKQFVLSSKNDEKIRMSLLQYEVLFVIESLVFFGI